MTFLATHLTPTIGLETARPRSLGLLIRIYPLNGIERPIQLNGQGIQIGRDAEADVRIEDDSVSRRHATISWEMDAHYVRDLGSTNGTFVNDTRVRSAPLTAGDRVRFGKQIFKYLTTRDIEAQYHEVVYKLMTVDGLTQVPNQRYFLETLERELIQSRRSQASLGVLVLDLDQFEAINDKHGHLAGDTVLTKVAGCASATLTSGQLFARLGGDEFGLLCPATTPSEAIAAGERIRNAVRSSVVDFESRMIPVTVSAGVAITTADETVSAPELLAAATRCLVLAKLGGRDQTRYEPESRDLDTRFPAT